MQVYFWGTRGSLPASITKQMIEAKLFKAVKMSRNRALDNDEAITGFIRNELPFTVRQTYGGNTSCVAIEDREDYVLCDAGTGLRDFGQQYLKEVKAGRKGLPKVFNIFISHPHWDHIQGFPFFIPAYIPGHQVRIFGCHARLEEAFTGQQNSLNFPVPLKAMGADISFHVLEPDKVYDIAGMAVKGIRQNHPGDSFGYSFVKDGKKVVYSTDAEHKKDAEKENYPFIAFFKDADLLIFDAQYSLADAVDIKENWGHSSNLMAVELAVRARVKRLCLYHSEHTVDDESLFKFLEDTRNYLKIYDESSPLAIDLAYDGLKIDI